MGIVLAKVFTGFFQSQGFLNLLFCQGILLVFYRFFNNYFPELRNVPVLLNNAICLCLTVTFQVKFNQVLVSCCLSNVSL
jgi:hypothetical protein